MYLIYLIIAYVVILYSTPYERCNEPFTVNNLTVKTCYYRTAYTTKYSVEYFDPISGETGKSGKHDSVLEAVEKGMNDLYNKNTIGYNCGYLEDIRYCYFYQNRKKYYKIIPRDDCIYISNNINKQDIDLAINHCITTTTIS